ncbi:MAG: ABC transporter substrate-binding protein [Bowdeniella nasicola]|nr:ABC transporter substrate-binding protein [Bowdeniella nasicola]
MKLRHSATIAATASVLLALGACSSSDGGDSKSGGSGDAGASTGIVSVNGTEPQNPLIPTNTNEVGGGLILDLIFEGLVYYDADGKDHLAVAESIESDDAQNYTIKLKEGLEFTNGDPVDAASFVDAWNYGANADNAQLSAYFFEPIEGYSEENTEPLSGLEIVDDTTFTVKLKQPEGDFPLRLGYSAFYPLPKSAWDDIEAFGQNPVGNGPYKFKDDNAWEHNVKFELVPNEDYAGERTPQNGGVEVKIYDSQDAAYNDLLANNLDIITAIPDSALSKFEDELGDRAINQPAAIFQSFTIAPGQEHFEGEEGELRRAAISHAINREEITQVIFSGTRTPAADFTSPVIAGWSDSVPGSDVLQYDEAKAKELWAQADEINPWSGTFTLAYNSDGGHQSWVEAVANSIKNTLGIEAEGNPYAKFSELRTDVTDRTIEGAFRTGWQADYPGLFNFLGPLYGTGAGSNDSDYSSDEFDNLLKQGSTETDVEKANEYFQQAQEVLFKDLPSIPLWYSNVTGGYADTVDNVKFGWNSVPLLYEVTKN